MKTLSQMLEEIEPVNDKFLRETFGDTNKYAFVDRASYDRMKQVAIELAKAIEYHHDVWGNKEFYCMAECNGVCSALSRAKDIIGGGK